MTLFEYLAIAFSLVISFTAIRLIGGLRHALDADRRYWVHLVYLAINLGGTSSTFWMLWSFKEVDWNYWSFVLVLNIPAATYYIACVLIPEQPDQVLSWRDYFYANRSRFFSATIVWSSLVAINLSAVLGVHWASALHASLLLWASLAIVGLVSQDARVHSGIALSYLAIGVFGYIIFLAQPAPLLASP